ncbi:MAG: hypothetical protein QXM86_04655 [Candidatus Bathyarchaeia archaeon]
MERLKLNVAKAFLGKNVNLHLKDGSVIVNVQLLEFLKDKFGRETVVKYVPYGKGGEFRIPLKKIARAEQLNLNMLKDEK